MRSRSRWRACILLFFALFALAAAVHAEPPSAGPDDGSLVPVDPDVVATRPGGPLLAGGFTPCSVQITVGDGQGLSGGASSPVPVVLTTSHFLSRVSLDVSDEPDLLAATGCSSLVAGFDCSVADVAGDAVVALTSGSGATIPSSTGLPILELQLAAGPVAFPTMVDLNPSNLDVTEVDASACAVTGTPGSFAVTTCGNGTTEGDEDCDDGNTEADGNCCSADCRFEPAASPCDDGLFCTSDDACDGAGVCAGGPTDCGDGVGCTADACDEDLDLCLHAVDDAFCDNGQFCDGVEVCDPVAGCRAGPPADCSDGVDCTADVCDEDLDQCHYTANDAVCDDGLFCDGVEYCNPVADCQAGPAVDCDDGIACTADACNESTDSCHSTPLDSLCSNGVFCDGAETCDPVAGCQAGAPPCAGDECNEASQTCGSAILAVSWNPTDSLLWIIDPAAGVAEVVGSTGIGGANSMARDSSGWFYFAGTHVAGGPAGLFRIDPATLATTDLGVIVLGSGEVDIRALAFSPAGVLYAARHLPSTRELWTIDSATLVGTLVGTLSVNDVQGMEFSPDGVLYVWSNSFGLLTVDPATGSIVDVGGAGTADVQTLFFDRDGNLYGAGSGLFAIDRDTGEYSQILDLPTAGWRGAEFFVVKTCTTYADCQDGLFCNGAEVCSGGQCGPGAAVLCDDGIECTVDACNEATDGCDHEPNDLLCDNGAFCDGVETCDADLGCRPATQPVECDDGEVCTDDSCDETLDRCVYVIDPDNGPGCGCGNGTLDAGEECDDGNTADGDCCSSDCLAVAAGTACDDGLFCTVDDACDGAGSCEGGGPRDCTDGQACTGDSCDETLDACAHDADDAFCDDGLFCNGVETCDASLGCVAGGTPCPVDCDEDNDACFPTGIPTVEEWGLVFMGLLLLTAGALLFRARRRTP